MIIYGIDVTPIVATVVEVLVGVLCTVIATKIVPWIKAKLDEKQLDIAKQFITLAVKAAEQLYEKEQGAEKLEYVKDKVISYLAEKNIKIDEEKIRAIIEAAVLELHNSLQA